jgi:uncharacterized protein YeeX (DUF496 family)
MCAGRGNPPKMSTTRESKDEDEITEIIEMIKSEKESTVDYALSSLKMFSEKREFKKKLVALGALRPLVNTMVKASS